MRKILTSLITFILVILTSGVGSLPASAAKCPPTDIDGKTVANLFMGKSKVEIKRVDYPKSGVLDPPKSPRFAGVSIRHQPLSAVQGSSIIVWHVSYHGCKGRLNMLSEAPLNTKFSVVDEKGGNSEYQVVKNFKIKKGAYEADWFRLNGSRQLVFVTCTGKVVNGHYTQNQILIAIPTQVN
jgi:hypothetical protein